MLIKITCATHVRNTRKTKIGKQVQKEEEKTKAQKYVYDFKVNLKKTVASTAKV